jgi:hypothetical protein
MPSSIAVPDPVGYISDEDDYEVFDYDDALDIDEVDDMVNDLVVPPPTPNMSPTPRYSLRPPREGTYAHRLDHQMDNAPKNQSYNAPTQFVQHSTQRVITAYVFTQMSAKAGIKVYRQPAIDVIFTEFTQLHDRGVFEPKHASSLTHHQKVPRCVRLSHQRKTHW